MSMELERRTFSFFPQSATKPQLGRSSAMLAVPLLSLLIGASLALGFYPIVAIIFAGFLVALLLMRPNYGVTAMAVLTLMVAGSLQYLWGISQFQWAISSLGILLLIIALLKIAFDAGVVAPKIDIGVGSILILWWIVISVSSLGNVVSVLDCLVGVRIYLPFAGMFAYVAYCRPPEHLLKNQVIFLLLIASTQWIFCLYQSTMIVPIRIAGGYPGSAWDSVVGSFGGDKFGGGESGSLGVFLAVSLTIAAALFKSGVMKTGTFSCIAICCGLAVGLSEAKVVMVLVPIGLSIVYRNYLLRYPLRFLIGCSVVIIFVVVMLAIYNYTFWQTESGLGFWDSVERRLSYSFDPQFRVANNNLGRIGSLVYWWDSHSVIDNPFSFLLGHGFASAVSFSGVIGMGSAAKASGVLLDTTGATKLLWESGLIGLILFLAMFVTAFFYAYRLARIESIPPWHRAALTGVQSSMVLMFLAVFYEVTAVSSPPMQFVSMLLLGYTVYWWRETGGGKC